MDYSKMSDPDVNEAVGKVVSRDGLTVKKSSGEVFIHEHVDYGEFKGLCTGWKVFEPCNNPADAWPIIMAARISIIQDTYEEEACAMSGAHTDLGWTLTAELFSYDVNPLRAAMICYLMMQEAK